MAYPVWVLKFKKKGTRVMKRAQMKTGEYLGRITPDGIIEPKTKRVMKRYEHISVKEYGSSFLL
ncbi:hypothetical protein, partial [Ferroplasma sp.]|uniref:hypothetical protein n=1 Tax=Ferroplasma sp. TaxID=2591003 RepID=UPI0026148BD8